MITLSAEEIHVWYTFTAEVNGEPHKSACYALLCESERARYSCFKLERDRHSFLVAHALLRTTLSRYASRGPEEWRFRTSPDGKPEIDSLECPKQLKFNISHTRELVGCATTIGRDVGLDVESIDESLIAEDVPEQFFSSVETRWLRNLPTEAQAAAFAELWTLKESYVKARGIGLRFPLDHVSFRTNSNGRPTMALAPETHHDCAGWQFALFKPDSRHRMAVAAREPALALNFAIMRTVPLLQGPTTQTEDRPAGLESQMKHRNLGNEHG